MDLIYGTLNPSKVSWMKEIVKPIQVHVKGLKEIEVSLVEPNEDGFSPMENAIQKAIGYYNQLKSPVFSCDSGLYFEGVLPEDQPGVHIKRIHGKDLKGYEFIKPELFTKLLLI